MTDRSALDACLEGITFPVDAGTIIECSAANTGCSGDAISQLGSTPDWAFGSREELYCEMGDSAACRASTW
jgi:hypothetical protein